MSILGEPDHAGRTRLHYRTRVHRKLSTPPRYALYHLSSTTTPPRRENSARLRRCRVHNRQRFSPGTRTRRGAPRQHLQEDCGALAGAKARSFCLATPPRHHKVLRESTTITKLHVRIGASPPPETKRAQATHCTTSRRPHGQEERHHRP